ncbi:MAG TPA: hypothetical protein VK919_12830 [Solirubrobacterales bacterium]|nr:hypothetical protein [Solirubrobacterales bacterium]
MRRIVIAVALTGVGVLAARALAPKLHERLMAGCKRMFEGMPDEFPSKRMMGGIEEIRANTAGSVEPLEQRDQGEAEAPGEVASVHALASPTQRR